MVISVALVGFGASPAFGQTPQERAKARSQAERELSQLQPIFVEQGVAILHELRELLRRPERPLEPWAEALRSKYPHLARRGVDLLLLVDGRPAQAVGDEADVRRGEVQKLLMRLAVTGRISRAEYENFVRDLQGR